jgi:O-antigen/teichoic acid export membrane protein
MVRPALRFGARAWIADLGSVTTARVDQLLMVPLVDRRELGLYVVAVTYAALPGIVGSALNTIISPRISQGDRELIGQSLRLTLGFLFASGAALAALAPVVIPFAFGAGFHGSVEMAWVLLVAGVPYGASLLLTSVLTSAGRPGVPALAQGVAAAITLVGLLIVLPTWGAIGAAYVSLVAYSVAMSVMLRVTSSAVGLSLGGLLRPRRSDVASALTALRSATSRRHRREKP